MNRVATMLVALLLLAAAAAGGYLVGQRRAGDAAAAAQATDAPATAASPGAAGATTEVGRKARRVLYYRNPMGLPDTSPVPKKDPMGMDYIPVYEGGDEPQATSGQIAISTDRIQRLGVRTEPAARRTLERVVRAAGRVEVDERRVYAVSPKFEGWVERLHVNATGQPVARGQPLFEVYSPELVSAQREYAIAVQGAAALKDAGPETQAGMRQLADSALARLRNWDISDEQIAALSRSGDAKRTLTLRSPVAGIVTEKKAVQGMRFMAGESLYQIADLSAIWVLADVFEQDIGAVRRGARAKIKVNAYPARSFEGAITYVYPTLNAQTRTVPVRVELPNPGALLKPAMFAEVELPVSSGRRVVTVPTSAVIDSGTRQIVLVQPAEGRFAPREVRLGERTDTHVEVLSGVAEGEQVVVAANFLIDAESNLRAAIGGFGDGSAAAGAAAGGANVPAAGGTAPQAAGPGVGAGAPAGGATAGGATAGGATADGATAGGAAAGGAPVGDAPIARTPAAVGHRGSGTIESIDAKAGTVELAHGPIATLKWPAMTMEFQLANAALAKGMKPSQPVDFEFVERKPGEWVVTKLSPRAAAGGHAGH